ncbi:MAG: GntR family transcriptional regulator [Pseudomonadota bacterium]
MSKLAELGHPVTDRIVDMIASGSLERAERIKEVEVSEKLGVSRIPLREAMRALASQGVLEARERGGMNVRAFTAAQIQELSDVRAALEPIAMRAAVPALQEKPNRIALNAIIEEMKWAVEQRDRRGIAAADIYFHNFLIELSANDLIRNIWSGLRLQMQIVFRLELCVPTSLEQVVPKHLALRDVLFRGDLGGLEAVVADHVRPELNPST